MPKVIAATSEVVDILIVEDSRTQAEQLRYLLEQSGYTVRVAGNGLEGLAAVRARRPTLVISDIVMPEMDGYALCRAIKSDPDLKEVPVVIVTSLSATEDIARSLECGADNFIRKPYDPKMLLARVQYMLLNLKLRRERSLREGMELYLQGKKHIITSEREQVVDLLISTYEEAVHMNEELQERQKDIARSNQILAALYRIADELNRVSTEREVCECTLQAALDLPRFEAGWIFLAEGETGCRLAASRNLPGALEAPAKAGDCACWRTYRAGGHERGTVLVECERLQVGGVAVQHATIPLWVDHRCLGVINLMASPGESFDQEELHMLDAIGNQVAVALERARLYEHLENLVAQRTAALRAEVIERTRAEERVARLNRIHAVLSGINTCIVRVTDRQELFDDACRIAVDYGGFGLAWIGLAGDEGMNIRPIAWRASDRWLADKRAWSLASPFEATRGGMVAEVLRTGRTVVCRDLASCPGEPLIGEAVQRDYRAMIALPLAESGKPIGMLALYASEPHLFDDDELRLLKEVAGDISFALDYLAKEARIDYLAYYDALTGLPNRALLADRLRQGIGFAQRHPGTMAVVCLDLDRFQIINDGIGHHAGDRVLRTVGERLAACLDEGDTLGRLGGDEFALICSEVKGEAGIARIAERVQAALAEPITLDDGEVVRLTASLGVSLYPDDGDDPDALLKAADLAMYHAKDQGRNNAQRFTVELGTRVAERLQVENRLSEALGRNEFVLHYQPQFDAVTGVIAGMESLIRWHHPQRGIVSPAEFIPIAEESGLIVRIGEWVLQEACRQNKLWVEQGLSDFPISVNVSMAQFRENSLLGSINHILDETGLDPRLLELEVTESLMMNNPETFISFLRQMKAQGVQVAIDDFGTGYSSFSYLKRLPVDRLKVDYSFVRDIIVDPGSASICRAVVALAHNLHLGVVAEGVESEAQAVYLAYHDCNSLQGFHLCRPAPAAEITAFLRDYEPVAREGGPPNPGVH